MTTTSMPPASTATAAPRTQSPLGLYIVLLAQLMIVLDATIVNVALPHIATLGFGPASLSWVLNAYTLAFGGLLLLGGRLGDVLGRRRIFLTGVAVFTVFSFVGGLAADPTMLVAARALQGVGAALAAPSVLALITTNAPDEAARNRALSAFAAVSSGGGGLGLILGGVLTEAISWRWTLFVNVPIGIAVILGVSRLVAETPRRHGKFDLVGAITATGGAVSLVYALVNAPDWGWGDARTIGLIVISILLFTGLVLTEQRHPHPLLRLGLLRNQARVAALVTAAAMFGSMLGMFYLTVQFLEDQIGLSALQAGLGFLPWPLSIFTLSRVMPRLVARFGAGRLMATGVALLVLAFAHLATLGTHAGYWFVMPSLLVGGIGIGLSFMPVTATVLRGVEPEHAGSASGLLQTMQQLGGAIGFAIVTSVFAAHASLGESGFVHGARAGFWTAAILAGLGCLSALTLVVRRPAAVPDAA
ncbi:MFS transporter [Nocardioides sp. Kera G14]|uniref:MFS transporter n=1 Tax=Nocardioides sp. Kera G14 TaxID=2884264 RepID=UPI001D11268A|nr:MFS transporter [Nocardioides sp. Kera G14]UDY23162.1 MFS transporter [Nocardioides sp. Kera G14]